jgi:hypothetical protein
MTVFFVNLLSVVAFLACVVIFWVDVLQVRSEKEVAEGFPKSERF